MVTVIGLVMGAAPAFAAQEHLDIIGQQCGTRLSLAPQVCACMQQSAGTQLTDNQQAFMAAQVTANGPEITRIQAELLTAEDAVKVMQFMTTVVPACGG
jgi:hypothetical protein